MAPVLARQLYTILKRKVLIRWSDLPERPDALLESGGANAPRAGEPRQSVLLGALELDGRDVAVRLNRIKPADAGAVWVFSAPTVGQFRHGPSELEQAIPESLKVDAFWDLHLWEVMFLPPALLLIGAIGVAVWRIFGRLSSRWTAKHVLRSARLPATLAAVALLLSYLTTDLLVDSSAASAVIEPTVLLCYVAAVVILVVDVVDAILGRMNSTDPGEMSMPDIAATRSLATGISAARRLLLVFAVLLSLGIVLTSANIFRTLGVSLIASARADRLRPGRDAHPRLRRARGSGQHPGQPADLAEPLGAHRRLPRVRRPVVHGRKDPLHLRPAAPLDREPADRAGFIFCHQPVRELEPCRVQDAAAGQAQAGGHRRHPASARADGRPSSGTRVGSARTTRPSATSSRRTNSG